MAESLVRQPSERERLTLARVLGVSYKRLHGWEPAERHEHYDADGELTGFTVVTREPEWDDHERARMLALAHYEAGVHDCGFHQSLLDDPTNVFMPEFKTCPVCRGAIRFGRVQAKSDETFREQNKDQQGAPDQADGRSMHMRLLSPDEAEKVRANQSQRRGGRPS